MSGQDWGKVTVRVSTQALKQQADEVSRRITSLTARFAELENAVRNTMRYWIGSAGEMHRSVYEAQKDDVEEMLLRLRDHPVNLLKIAGVYDETEARQAERLQALEENVIV